jgi:3,4-dihydroxy 2-butanone 4-phosphate synthase / GTP cyclohydrolase II
MSIGSIPQALAALRQGKPVLVADDEGRENEGDIILAAELATQEWVAWTVKHSSGYLCAPMTNELADALELPLMVENSEDPRRTAYTVSVDAADRISTGISARDRAHTLRVLADPASTLTV